MTRFTPLWRSDHLNVYRFDHPPEHEDRFIETLSDRCAASFVERGEYLLEVGEARWRVGEGDVLLMHPGLQYRARGVDGPFNDVGLTIHYLSAAADAFDAARTWARAREPLMRASNRLRYLYWGIAHAVGAGLPLLAETCASEIFREIPEGVSSPTRLYGTRKLAWYAQRIHHAKEVLETHYARDHRLAGLARAAGMSAFHFARVFKELTGASPHQCLMAARLNAAASMLREGRCVTDTCFACGFANLSYFCRLFARRFGASPSAYAGKRARVAG
jgi:AraC-like DNA-binding protein